MTTLTRWVLAHKRLVVATWLLLTVGGIAAAGPAGRALSKDYSVPGREGWETNQTIERAFHTGGDSAPLVAVLTLPAGVPIGSPVVRSGLLDVSARLGRAVPGSRIASYESNRGQAFVSSDGRTTFVLAYPPPEPGSYGTSPKAAKAAARALAGVKVAGAPVYLSGLDALTGTTTRSGGPGVLVESLLGGLGALVVLGFVFASLLAFVPMMIAFVSIMTSFLLVLGLTEITQVSSIVEFLIALVGLGIAIDYSLLVVVRWREERAHGHAGDEAIVRAMARAGRAVVFSGTTVAVGLLALIVLPVPFLRSIGYGGMVIPVVSVVCASTLLPIILAKWGARLDWPHKRTDDRASRAWTRWARLVVRGRWPAATAATAVLLALLLAATSLQFGDSAGNPDLLARQGGARAGLVALERSGVGVGVLTPIEMLTTQANATRLSTALEDVPGVHGASAPSGPAWRRSGRAVVDVLPIDSDSTGSGRATLTRVRHLAHAEGAGQGQAGVGVGGVMAQNQDFVSAVYGNFPLMVVLIAVITFVLLARAFRSLLLPLKAVLLNILSVGAAWGALTLVWQQGIGSKAIWGISASGSIPSWMPVMIFAFLFGLSMDYEVFILSRMREEYDATGSTRQAVVTGIGRTGRLVTSAALILFLTFVAMASGPQVQIKMLATGLAAGILIDATLIRALLVPALVSLFGRWNWWLPRRPARLLGVEPSLPPRATPAETGA
jgi:putative drug exporter of the RND superfamily